MLMMTTNRSKYPKYFIASLLLFVLAVLPYLYILKLPFLGIDTIPTIASAKIESIVELPNVFIRELRGGITPYIAYYRPLTLVTYTIDYAFWEWKPFGYHLTDLVLHGLAVVSVLWMALLAFERRLIESFLVGILFLMHPVANEIVPAISRRQEPLFMIGLAFALMGAAKMPRLKGWVFALLGSIIAIMSVERALITPAILLIFLYLIRLEKRSLIERIQLSVLWSLPFFAFAVAFYALRWLLFGNSGIQFSLGNLIKFPISYAVSVIYPQQIIALRWPTEPLLIVLVALVSVILAIVIANIFIKSPQHNLYFFCCIVILIIGMFLATAGQLLPWYPFVAAAFFALLVVALAFEAIKRFKNLGWNEFRSVATLISIAVILLSLIVVSPFFGDYGGWRVASEQMENITSELLHLIDELPRDTGLVLINVPSHYQENNSEYRITRSAAILWPYSLQPWLDAQDINNPVIILGTSAHIGMIRTPEVQLSDSNTMNIYFDEKDSIYSGSEFEWPPQQLEGKHFRSFIYNGEQFVELSLSQD